MNMKKIAFYSALALCCFGFAACSSSKKVEKSPIKTFVMPCQEFVSGDGALRAWASGTSDSEMTARKKAQVAAATGLATQLQRTLLATVEDYTTTLGKAMTAESKTFFNERIKSVTSQTLKGTAIVCERWHKDETTGQYTNYMVMELRGEEFLEQVYNQLQKSGTTGVDKNLLEKLFIENINKSAEE